jgi:hypothetical protein
MSKRSPQPHDVRREMKTARQREIQYSEESTPKPKFIHWLRGKFGVSVAERHGYKVAEMKVGKPYTRVQHRNGSTTR